LYASHKPINPYVPDINLSQSPLSVGHVMPFEREAAEADDPEGTGFRVGIFDCGRLIVDPFMARLLIEFERRLWAAAEAES